MEGCVPDLNTVAFSPETVCGPNIVRFTPNVTCSGESLRKTNVHCFIFDIRKYLDAYYMVHSRAKGMAKACYRNRNNLKIFAP
jgi:hypothetical protein